VLVPTPSYPLFDHLARAEAIRPVPYPLLPDQGWRIGFDELHVAIDGSSRAIVAVSPNNPTGSCLRRGELSHLLEVCAGGELALVCDEVFSDYTEGYDPQRVVTVAAESRALTFALSGLSKVAALPQLKLGWIVVAGPEHAAERALARLEFLADLYLSVATPVQWALPRLLETAPQVRDQVSRRIRANRQYLDALASGASACRVLQCDGGWYAVLRIPRVVAEEALALEMLERFDVVVHPGYFFDFASEGWLVVSLLTTPDVFERGTRLVVEYLDAMCGRVV
jgi:aspartate/methionine/tyrosine aminotransferase